MSAFSAEQNASANTPPLLVDSHCHLNFPDYKDDLDDVVERARAEGVRVMQTICTRMREFDEIHAIAEKYDNIYCSVGVHPNNTAEEPLVELKTLTEKAALPKVIGLGETGLDYYYEHSDREIQQKSFRVHLQAGAETGLPIIVHTRDADEDTVAMIKEATTGAKVNGLIHCFSTTKYLAEEAIKYGFYVSLSGIITFKKAEELRDIVKDLPIEKLLVETDAPYLAPTPYRGKRNEPGYTRYTNRLLAELKNISEEECARITTENFFRLFSKATPPEGGQ